MLEILLKISGIEMNPPALAIADQHAHSAKAIAVVGLVIESLM